MTVALKTHPSHKKIGTGNEIITDETQNHGGVKEIGTDKNYKHKIVWFNAIAFLILHLAGVYGWYQVFAGHLYFKSVVYLFTLGFVCGEGIAIGAHRLYTHKSFKATLPLKIALLIMQTMAGQNCMWEWVRDHRQHHKYSDTDADPHNASRGLFFSHIGWLMSRKHPKVIEYGKKIDMSDLEADRLVMLQKEHFLKIYFVVGFLIPTLVPMYLWNESLSGCFFALWAARNITQLNIVWMLNSLSHAYGYKPYDSSIKPTESVLIAFFTSGEGWHNYHHAFPWDYRSAEIGMIFNQSAVLIDIFARLRLAYDLRTASTKMIESHQNRLGDGSYTALKNMSYLRKISILLSKNIKALGYSNHMRGQ